MRKVLLILNQLSDDDVEWLATHGLRHPCPAGSELIALNSEVDALYFVLDGSFGVYAPSGDKVVDLGSGEVLGEMSLVDPAPTTASVRANIDSVVLRLDMGLLQQKLNEDMAFAAHFYRSLAVFLADRVRSTTRKVGQGSGKPDQDKLTPDEVSEEQRDPLHLAKARFDRLLKRLAG